MTTKPQTVVTYRAAYLDIDLELCARHGAGSHACGYSIGPVIHGAHVGTCDACEDEFITEADRAADEED